jgi:type II secretory ATPase GspE/PulE/Tfp pilus assembly ATPase PilB-like protein
VMRLLGVGATNLKLDQLGLIGRAYKVIEHELSKPNGMIITTGPTGSGKTTTLYAFLNELNEPGVKIITLEDPVEYKLEGIQQTPIDYRVDFSFVKGLRAILRQDPDIVMVGEIRDPETAETALQAALTGHIVLSTLHTNDAAGAVPRLITMGVKPFVIAPAVNAIIAQRLVRKLCPSCKKPATIQAGVIERVEKILQDISKAADVTLPKKLTWYHAEGCQECHGLGYKGRIGIYEVIEVNDTIRTMIMENASGVEIKKQAHGDGTVTMVQDGLLKALEGITDIEEVFRVAGDE